MSNEYVRTQALEQEKLQSQTLPVKKASDDAEVMSNVTKA